MNHPEYDLQCRIAAYLREKHPGIVFTASIAGHAKLRIPQWKRAVKSGYRKGFPDLFIFEPVFSAENQVQHGLAMELKSSRKAKMTPEQDTVLSELVQKGYTTACCYEYDMAIDVIEGYLKGE